MEQRLIFGQKMQESMHILQMPLIELKNIIDNEDKRKPLSDQKLQKILADKEIKISRRTIAKYREELKILPSYLRKI
ncbi:MAG: hypothetical protein KKA34_00865 [Candidatus Omnitrophica bacterium]|nr:hypothetical protein [Candidatus Omnitrophota bacterium]